MIGDENRYLQILVNFLTNALKFSPRESNVDVLLILKVKEVEVEDNEQLFESQQIESKTSHVLIDFDIVIRDYGCGISEEQQSNLFMDFGRLTENAHMNRQGVGLGLSICQKLIS